MASGDGRGWIAGDAPGRGGGVAPAGGRKARRFATSDKAMGPPTTSATRPPPKARKVVIGEIRSQDRLVHVKHLLPS